MKETDHAHMPGGMRRSPQEEGLQAERCKVDAWAGSAMTRYQHSLYGNQVMIVLCSMVYFTRWMEESR